MTDCGLANLGACLPEAFFQYISSLLSQPLQYLIDGIRHFMTVEIDIGSFAYLWAVVIYILSLFYGLLIMWSGFNFIISGYDSVKREQAKSWFRGVIIMMVLVQASYFLYEIAIDVNASMTAGVFSMIDPSFFQLQADNFGSFALELIFLLLFVAALLFVFLLLLLRYMFVCIGVVFLPIAIFFYFIPFLRSAGESLVSLISALIFLSFFYSLVLLGGSMIAVKPEFQDLHIIVQTCSFVLIILVTWLIGFFAATKPMGNTVSNIISVVGKKI